MSRGRDLDPPSPSRTDAASRHAERDRAISDSSRTNPARSPREALREHVDLPRGSTRESVSLPSRDVQLRDSEVEVLTIVGTFRVVDVRDVSDREPDRWHGDLDHLREQRLVDVTPHLLNGERTALITLTEDGRAVLERHRSSVSDGPPQEYYAGLVKPREATHDAQIFRLYQEAAKPLQEQGATIRRVVLDFELKRDFQRFLQDPNRGRPSSTGRPQRTAEEIRQWADEHQLPSADGHVQFPDLRIEYEHPDGTPDREDLELTTEHYSARAIGAKQSAGFSVRHSRAGRLRGGSSKRGRAPFEPVDTRRKSS